jgi:hypothetical protein
MTTHDDASTNDGMWLGWLTTANHLFANFEPFARLVDGKWERIKPEDRMARFPRKGLVRAKPDPAFNHRTHSAWVFECHRKGNDVEQWWAEEPERAIPLIDMSDKPRAEARTIVCQTGLQLPDGFGHQVAVVLEGSVYCHIRLEHREKGGSVARLPSNGLVELRPANPAWTDDDAVLFLPTKGKPNNGVVSRIDWSSDADFLGRVVDRYRAAVGGYLALGRGTDAPAKRIEKALHDGRVGPGDAVEVEAIAERLRTDWPAIARGLHAVEGMTALLMDTPEAKALLAAAVDRTERDLRPGLEARLRVEAESKLAARREEISRTESAVDEAKRELASVQVVVQDAGRRRDSALERARVAETEADATAASCEARQRELDELKASSESVRGQLSAAEKDLEAAREAHQRLRADVGEFVASVRREVALSGAADRDTIGAFAARLHGLLGEMGVAVPPLAPSSTPPWWVPAPGSVEPLEFADLFKQISQAAAWHGVVEDDLALIDCFARAGEPVLLLGEHAELSLRAYACSVSAGEICTHALDPAAIGLDDIWRNPAGQRPTAFALAWHRATVSPDEMVLLCLRDIDSSPFHLWMSSLHAVLSSDRRPRNLLVLATSSSVSAEEPRSEDAIAALRNCLVALKPRGRPDGAKAGIVFDEGAVPQRRLRFDERQGRKPSRAAYNAVLERGLSTVHVRRALRLLSAAGEGEEQVAATAAGTWLKFLQSGIAVGLPPALAAGYDALAGLHVQR